MCIYIHTYIYIVIQEYVDIYIYIHIYIYNAYNPQINRSCDIELGEAPSGQALAGHFLSSTRNDQRIGGSAWIHKGQEGVPKFDRSLLPLGSLLCIGCNICTCVCIYIYTRKPTCSPVNTHTHTRNVDRSMAEKIGSSRRLRPRAASWRHFLLQQPGGWGCDAAWL